LATVGDRTILAIAAPVCSGAGGCARVGATIVGVGVDGIAVEALRRGGAPAELQGGIAIFDRGARLVASAGDPSVTAMAAPAARVPVRVNQRLDGTSVTTLFTPLELGGRPLGTLAVSIPVEPNLASVRRTALGLGLMLLAAMAGIAVVGIIVSRLVLRQVRSLVTTNRALGRGELSARAHVLWNDEIGEVGTLLNEMAEQLQAMYETLEARVAERTEEVERLLRERTEFFASVSHELRTPLAVILRHAEMLLDTEYRKNGRWSAQAGNALKDSGGQLARLIDDILQLAEAEAGAMAVDLGPVDIGGVIRDMRTTIEPLARAAGLKPSVRVPRDLPLALADEQRIRQIVLNLVDNAVKYTPEGGRVEVVVEEHPGWVELRVADTGIGFPPDCGDRIFEPFYRVKGTEPQGGQASSGLGLAVAKRLVEAHGGRIAYRSTPGQGSTFTVRFRRVGDPPRADRLEMKAHGRGRDA
jgi:signal transduction histidine kinase